MILLATTSVTFRTDEETKRQATAIFADLGMDMTTGVNVLLRALVREKGFPFAVTLESTAAYRSWMKSELAKSWARRNDPSTQRYTSEEVWKQLGIDS